MSQSTGTRKGQPLRLDRRAMGLGALASLTGLLTGRALAQAPIATEDEVRDAYAVLLNWITAFQAEDYMTQWRLTDSRIRRYYGRRRWREAMRAARARSGALLEASVAMAGPIDAANLPCTEMGHCYHADIQYAIFTFRTRYEIAAPGQPEFAVMARSDEGWRFGGGTFPDRPLGESAVILDAQTERHLVPTLQGDRLQQ
jgi:hypothetical protein